MTHYYGALQGSISIRHLETFSGSNRSIRLCIPTCASELHLTTPPTIDNAFATAHCLCLLPLCIAIVLADSCHFLSTAGAHARSKTESAFDFLLNGVYKGEPLGLLLLPEFQVEHRTVDARQSGVPQSRKRVFVIGLSSATAYPGSMDLTWSLVLHKFPKSHAGCTPTMLRDYILGTVDEDQLEYPPASKVSRALVCIK
jgi:hypothetical protein